MALLLLAVIGSIVAGWRYFPGFIGDHAWYLQVALRLSQGEILYRDVAWAYGPLPAQALAAFFRWLGPDAGWASLINGTLTVFAVLLTYTVTHSLLTSIEALIVTAFATLAGPSVWGGLFHIQYYSYTQAIAWGAVLSLAALAAALRWQRTRHATWLGLAGAATGLAILSKPEFGLTALGASAVAIASSRGNRRAWAAFLAGSALTVVAGFGIQAGAAGWRPLARGVMGYNQVSDRQSLLWGLSLGNRRLLIGGYAFWIAVAAFWAGRHWPRWRLWCTILAGLAGLAVVAVAVSYLLDLTGRSFWSLLSQDGAAPIAVTPANLLFLVALPWAPLVPLLLAAGWLARRRSLAPAWWALWTYALLSNLRLVLTGYASGLAVAPALAVLWVWLVDWLNANPQQRIRYGRIALAVVAGLAAINILAQVAVPDNFYNQPRVSIRTAVGTVRIPQEHASEMVIASAFVDQAVPPDAPIFAAGWGAPWYLVTGRANPTAFDVALLGLGLSGTEATDVEAALLTQTPAAVILPGTWSLETDCPGGNCAARSDSDEMRTNLPTWWQLLNQEYADQTPPTLTHWRVLVHRTQ